MIIFDLVGSANTFHPAGYIFQTVSELADILHINANTVVCYFYNAFECFSVLFNVSLIHKKIFLLLSPVNSMGSIFSGVSTAH